MADFDPFVVDTGETEGYSPNQFMTNRGTESSEPQVFTAKMHRQLHALIHALFVQPKDRFPAYKSVHDFINDACWHRLMWLREHMDVDLPPDEQEYWDSLGLKHEMLHIQERRQSQEETARLAMSMGQEAERNWKDPHTLSRLLETINRLRRTLPDEQAQQLGPLQRKLRLRLLALRQGRVPMEELDPYAE